MSFTLPDLPYAQDSLQPYMSAETLAFHHGKHHAAYVAKANELIGGTGWEGRALEEVCIAAFADKSKTPLFNNVAQIWNHTFFWEGMTPKGGGSALPETLAKQIDSDLGGFESFRARFVDACVTQFGSGWGWLVRDDSTGRLEIMKTPNAEMPMLHGKTALLTCDVWEHAYYIDYRNARPKFVEAFVDHLIDWERVEARLVLGKS